MQIVGLLGNQLQVFLPSMAFKTGVGFRLGIKTVAAQVAMIVHMRRMSSIVNRGILHTTAEGIVLGLQPVGEFIQKQLRFNVIGRFDFAGKFDYIAHDISPIPARRFTGLL